MFPNTTIRQIKLSAKRSVNSCCVSSSLAVHVTGTALLMWVALFWPHGLSVAYRTTMGPLTWPSEHKSSIYLEPLKAALGRSRDYGAVNGATHMSGTLGLYKQASNRLFQKYENLWGVRIIWRNYSQKRCIASMSAYKHRDEEPGPSHQSLLAKNCNTV